MKDITTIQAAPDGVFQKTDFGHQESRAAVSREEFPRSQTHGIAQWPRHRLLADSRGLGWHDSYTSLATEDSWDRTLPAVPHLCLAYCLHSAASVTRTIDGESRRATTELRPRLLGVVPENRTSQWMLRGTPDIQLVYLRRAMVERVAAEALGMDASRIELVPQLGFSDPLLEQLMLSLLETARTETGGSDGLYADHVARLMALHLLRRHAARPGQSPAAADRPRTMHEARVRHVRDLIEAALGEDLSLERLAGAAGVGAHAFAAAFQRAVGMSPHRYVLERRVERAKQLLRNGQAPMTEVALQTGFASQSHLATVFRRAVGQTPGEYRRGNAGR